jgi:hypothetical protein
MYARAVPPITETPSSRASSSRGSRPSRRVARLLALVVAASAVSAGCGTISRSGPPPTPADFPSLAGILSQAGITVSNVVSGDAGCPDADLAKTAIGFDAVGADQTTPIRIRIFIFRNREVYTKERATVDQCAASFVTDPDTFESLDASPFVVAGQGPWAPTFKDRLRTALVQAAGTGG